MDFYQRLSQLTKLALIFLLLFTTFAFSNQWFALAEYIVSFRPHLFVLSAATLVMFIALRDKTYGALAAICLIINGGVLLPYYRPVPTNPQSNLSLLFYNVDKNVLPYTGVDGVVNMITGANPDVVVLREVGREESAELRAKLTPQYPHTFHHQDANHDGVLLLSQLPLENSQAITLGAGRKSAIADIVINNSQLQLVAPHPTNALFDFDERNQQLEALADYADQVEKPLVLVGDLNVTMWSSWYKKLEQTDLRNSRLGKGIMPSWQSPLPLLKLPLDHVLISSQFDVHDFELLPSLGSDHQPLIAHLYVEQ